MIGLVLSASSIDLAWAGPPYISDDPEPTNGGHWEIYHFVQGVSLPGTLSGQTGLDLNYGAYKDLQLTAVIPADYETGPRLRFGFGDIQLAAKYRFLHQDSDSLMPDVAFFPRVFVPTSNSYFGNGRANVFLPIWAQKDFGKWSLFGGGGYSVNPGPLLKNSWLTGVVLQRSLTDVLSLGIELYHQTPTVVTVKQFTGLNLGMSYKLSNHWSFIAAGGPGLQNARENGRFDFYAALKADF